LPQSNSCSRNRRERRDVVMDRRTFISGITFALLAAPLAGEAQQVGKVPRVGYLLSFRTRHQNQAFWDGLHALGYIEGHNIIVERRYVEGKPERYSDLAAELVRLRVDVIVADGAEATRAARQATRTIPIVMVAADPVALGLIVSLGRPGGNITGLSTNAPELMGKRLQILKEALPNVLRVAVLANVSNPWAPSSYERLSARPRRLGCKCKVSRYTRAASSIERSRQWSASIPTPFC
jgi:putative ABC transport system substrate-binding protein